MARHPTTADERTLVAVATVIRWLLEIGMIWGLVFPETGPWTAITLTMIAVGIEANYVSIERIKGALVALADEMVTAYKSRL